jgi:uncharacterized membrane protein
MKMWWIVFVIGAALSWGCYVPMLHEGQKELGGGKPPKGPLRAFLCVGIAYFITAVLVPAAFLWGAKLEETSFEPRGTTFAIVAGALGAAGALCIIFAMKNGGTPMYVPPLVFAGAPIINALVSMTWHPPARSPGVLFFVGLVMAAVGAGLVLYSKAQAESPGKVVSAPADPGGSSSAH